MMCFLAGPEMKFPQNSFELQVEFFEVKIDLQKLCIDPVVAIVLDLVTYAF